MAPAGESIVMLSRHSDTPLKLTAKSVPSTSGIGVPSTSNIWAANSEGGASQVPPAAVSGS